MTAITSRASQTATMLGRDLRHAQRYPAVTVSGLATPVVILLLFDGVFGHTLRSGIGGPLAGRGYIDYLVPGILVIVTGGVAEATAINVSTDMKEGIIARFRTMAIWQPAVLAGQVAGSLLRAVITGALVLAVAIGLGFAPSASPAAWLAATGLFMMLALALSWLTVAFGLLAKSPEGANSLALIPLFLPFVSSAFVPTGSMPAGVAAFAANQPFTPVIDTLRGLLVGGPIGGSALAAVAWCAGIAVVGYLWALRLYKRNRTEAG
jgi:ABC-2 type transport system permease protein